MKKLLWSLTVLLMIVSCKDEKKTNLADDSEFVTLSSNKKIEKKDAEDMKDHFKNSGKTPSLFTFDWKLYKALLPRYKEVLIVPARYRLEDEPGYRVAWGLPESSNAGTVEDYISFILQCIPKDDAATEEPDYYHFAQICPPPEDANGNCASYMFKSSDSSAIADSAINIKIDSIKK